MKVLVTDGNSRAALAITRSLGAQGHNVIVGADEAYSIAGASKYCSKCIQYPDPSTDKLEFIDHIHDMVSTEKIEFLLPTTDVTLLSIAENFNEFAGLCHVPFADPNALATAANKFETFTIAEKLGIPVPDSVVLKEPSINPSDIGDLSFPVVIKPSHSRISTDTGWQSTSVSYATDMDDLSRQLKELPDSFYPIILQRRISGPGLGVFLCMKRGEVIASFAHRRIREKPPSGGVSVLRESIRPHDQALKYAERLLNELNWHGVAMVEFKLEEETGIPFLMEINGRFWGSLQLAIDSGVDFPMILLRIIQGDNMEPVTEYQYGVRSRWLWGELDLLLMYLFKSRQSLNLPDHHESRPKSVLRILSPFVRNQRLEVLRLSDLGPWICETKQRFSH